MRRRRSTVFRVLGSVCLAVPLIGAVYGIALWKLSASNPAAIKSAKLQADANLAQAGLFKGLPVFMRIFKQESQLELWMKSEGQWTLFKSFAICAWSGKLGPKLREGDRQSPEGFYRVTQDNLNPNSSYHLSFNLGFPNSYDRSHGRTGSFLMVHGNCVSIGCYAMTDPGIEVIYSFVEAALKAGQPHVPVHIFPFRMTAQIMQRNSAHQWASFWAELKPAYDHFEATKRLPRIDVQQQTYVVSAASIRHGP